MPIRTTTETMAQAGAAAISATAITAFGVPLGLHADVLLAGFLGSLVAIILLDAVPGTSDNWRALVRTSARRLSVAWASSITAGYLTPLAMLQLGLGQHLLLPLAFAIGVAAQRALVAVLGRLWPAPTPAAPPADNKGGQP